VTLVGFMYDLMVNMLANWIIQNASHAEARNRKKARAKRKTRS
jgi:hypothetical protein